MKTTHRLAFFNFLELHLDEPLNKRVKSVHRPTSFLRYKVDLWANSLVGANQTKRFILQTSITLGLFAPKCTMLGVGT